MAVRPDQPFIPPPANRETFKDLLVFEERLKQNAERLQRQRIKYEAFLITMVLVSLLLGYKTLIAVSPYKLIHYLYVSLLLVAVTTLVLFFATGMYTDQIAYAYKFIPQTNRALRPFNMFLNPPASVSTNWLLTPRPFRSSSSPTTTTTTIAPLSPDAKVDRHLMNLNPRGEILFSTNVKPEFVDGYARYRRQWEVRQQK